jgi:hypothetical protein
LNGNLINGIELLAFDGLAQLQYLDLSDNNLTVSDFFLYHFLLFTFNTP